MRGNALVDRWRAGKAGIETPRGCAIKNIGAIVAGVCAYLVEKLDHCINENQHALFVPKSIQQVPVLAVLAIV